MRLMLAQAITIPQLASHVRYPTIVQIKYDGIRGALINNFLISRSGKHLPNLHVQNFFNRLAELVPDTWGLDGELVVGEPNDPHVCMNTTSGIMSQAGLPNFKFYAFDLISEKPYMQRREQLMKLLDSLPEMFRSKIVPAAEFVVNDHTHVEHYMNEFLAQGLEGCILRSPQGLYKEGRSTLKQQYLLKLKDIVDDEGVVVGFEELHKNLNEAQLNEIGYTKRSSHKDNMLPMDMLGALVVRSPKWGLREFRIGTGFDDMTRRAIWNKRHYYVNRIVKFKYLRAGMKDLPRHPVFLGWRAAEDIDETSYAILKALMIPGVT